MFKTNRVMSTSLAVIVACCLLAVGGAEAGVVIMETDAFPAPMTRYDSEEGTGFGVIDTEIVSMSLLCTHPVNVVSSPPRGDTFRVDSFFDVFFELDLGGGGQYQIDSFFDVFTELSIENVTPAGATTGRYETEIVSMDLTGAASSVITSGAMIRLDTTDPDRRPLGTRTITTLSGGNFEVDSFFDVFTELSVDGGGNWLPADRAMRMTMSRIPEPATLTLLCMGGLALHLRRRKSRRVT